ncbi:MAG: Crp/Fnr family transcriptional regulator, partial [Acutalibacteraceae bacterium]|nr:Crp/Fnr family transcriptional regulator [Acutalibacteraceae bacterium]
MINKTIYSSDTLHLPEEAVKLFDSFGTEKTYKKDVPLYFQGELAECFYYLKQGSVKTFFNSADGLQKTISIVGKGSILGEAAFFDRMPRVSSARTISQCKIISVTHKQLEDAFTKDPKLALHLLKVQAQSIRMLSAQVSGMVFTKADCRIANQLLQSQTILNGEIIVNLTHEEIGNLVGVSRVTASKILNSFASEGIIKTAYRYIILTDIEKL